jgi:hypothetical protein
MSFKEVVIMSKSIEDLEHTMNSAIAVVNHFKERLKDNNIKWGRVFEKTPLNPTEYDACKDINKGLCKSIKDSENVVYFAVLDYYEELRQTKKV